MIDHGGVKPSMFGNGIDQPNTYLVTPQLYQNMKSIPKTVLTYNGISLVSGIDGLKHDVFNVLTVSQTLQK